MRAVHQRICTFGAGAACGVSLGGALRPQIEERLHGAPATFDLRGTLKQRLVARLHVIEQSFVAGLVAHVEMVPVAEIHGDRRSVHDEPRPLDHKLKADALVGLNLHHKTVGGQPVHHRLLEKRQRHVAELDDDLGITGRQRLPGAQIEGHARPPPRLHVQLERGEGLRAAGRVNVGLIEIGGNGLASDGAGAIAPANCLGRVDRADGGNDLLFLRPDRIGIEADRRLHRYQRQQLEEMIGNHVAQCAGGIVEAAAGADGHRLGRRYLDMIDVAVVPDGFHHGVAEACDHDVLHGLLPKEMIDPVDLGLAGAGKDLPVQRLCRGKVGPERFFDHDAAETIGLVEQPFIAELIYDGTEEGRRCGEVEDRVPGKLAAESLIHSRIGEIALQIADTTAEPWPVGIVLHEFVKRLAQLLVVAVMMADTDERHVLIQQAGPSEVNERGYQQSAGEVPKCAEDNESSRGCSQSIAHCGISTWPPKPNRIAESSLSPNVVSTRLR